MFLNLFGAVLHPDYFLYDFSHGGAIHLVQWWANCGPQAECSSQRSFAVSESLEQIVENKLINVEERDGVHFSHC